MPGPYRARWRICPAVVQNEKSRLVYPVCARYA